MGGSPSEACAPSNAPVLRLRPTTSNQEVEPKKLNVWKRPDGPWLRHPDEIDENLWTTSKAGFPLDTSIEDYRILYMEHSKDVVSLIRQWSMSGEKDLLELKYVSGIRHLLDMNDTSGMSDEEVECAIEQNFVHHDLYLQPGSLWPPFNYELHRNDWSGNARGIYYRHYYSPHWVTADHDLWVPIIDDRLFDDPSEEHRRERARKFLQHTLDNARWNKSEYAWEADAWATVFDQMRNDPALSTDKRDYWAQLSEVHPVSCTLTGKSKVVKRIPDASFGLATFRPEHYQNAVAAYELDVERLQALTLHRNSGLITDPHCGEADMVFPFAIYEAKGWSGDPREARHQACAAGAAYLDMLDALARVPGSPEKTDREYQSTESRNSQVFALTSFGAQWHVMVGYKRPRLKREHAGHPGMSNNVYLFQRLWSGRITNERKAWELLAWVDQIHLWGVTTFRDYVIRHLRPWHEYSRMLWAYDARHMRFALGKDMATSGEICISHLPSWVDSFGNGYRNELEQRSAKLVSKACLEEQPGEPSVLCVLGRCGTENFPGYSLFSPEEHTRHVVKVHNEVINESWRKAIAEIYRLAALDEVEDINSSYSEVGKRKAQERLAGERETKRRKRRVREVEEDGNMIQSD